MSTWALWAMRPAHERPAYLVLDFCERWRPGAETCPARARGTACPHSEADAACCSAGPVCDVHRSGARAANAPMGSIRPQDGQHRLDEHTAVTGRIGHRLQQADLPIPCGRCPGCPTSGSGWGQGQAGTRLGGILSALLRSIAGPPATRVTPAGRPAATAATLMASPAAGRARWPCRPATGAAQAIAVKARGAPRPGCRDRRHATGMHRPRIGVKKSCCRYCDREGARIPAMGAWPSGCGIPLQWRATSSWSVRRARITARLRRHADGTGNCEVVQPR